LVTEHENLIDGNVTNERHYAETRVHVMVATLLTTAACYGRHVAVNSSFPTLAPGF